MVLPACNSAAEMRYWCLEQANTAGVGSDDECAKERVEDLYYSCLRAHNVPRSKMDGE